MHKANKKAATKVDEKQGKNYWDTYQGCLYLHTIISNCMHCNFWNILYNKTVNQCIKQGDPFPDFFNTLMGIPLWSAIWSCFPSLLLNTPLPYRGLVHGMGKHAYLGYLGLGGEGKGWLAKRREVNMVVFHMVNRFHGLKCFQGNNHSKITQHTIIHRIKYSGAYFCIICTPNWPVHPGLVHGFKQLCEHHFQFIHTSSTIIRHNTGCMSQSYSLLCNEKTTHMVTIIGSAWRNTALSLWAISFHC